MNDTWKLLKLKYPTKDEQTCFNCVHFNSDYQGYSFLTKHGCYCAQGKEYNHIEYRVRNWKFKC